MYLCDFVGTKNFRLDYNRWITNTETFTGFSRIFYCGTEKGFGHCPKWYILSQIKVKGLLKAATGSPDDRGPMKEYDARVAAGQLRDDEHQRGQQHMFTLYSFYSYYRV